MKLKKKLVALLAGLVTTVGFLSQINSITANAEQYWPSEVTVDSEAAIVMEQETGTILYSKNMDTQLYPASITKIMTALIVLENCELDEIVTFSEDAVYKNEGDTSHIARDVGEQMTVEQTLYGMMLESANECAWALGEHVTGGDIDAFVDMMNAKAEELGCKNTHFSNPNGLPDEDHYTSAYDMALISRAAYAIPKFAEIVGTKSYTIPPTNKHSDSTPLNNHHCMLNYYKTSAYLYDYCLGGKTGYTTEAGSTLVTYARKDNMTLIVVTMNAKSPAHYVDTRNLFDYCFDNFTIYNVSENATISNEDTDVTGILSESIDLIKIDTDGIIVLPKTATFNDATSTVVSYTDPDDSNVVGQMYFEYANMRVGSANLIFSSVDTKSYPFDNISVEEGGSGKEYIQVDYLRIGLIVLAVLLIVAIVLFIRSKSSDILLFKHRFKANHATRSKTNFKKIRRNYNRRHRR